MAFMLVTLARVKSALKVDGTDDDSTLEIYISAASLLIVDYLKGQAGDFLSIDSPPDSPANDLAAVDERVVAAIIGLVGVLYREPDGDTAKNFGHGQLPFFVTALLYSRRDPTIA